MIYRVVRREIVLQQILPNGHDTLNYSASLQQLKLRPLSIMPPDLSLIPEKPVSRLAPTPSGFLHLGNAVNFLLTWAIVRCLGGTLHLRIDDMDGIRFNESVLEDIFVSLEWLGLDWDLGPSGPDDFGQSYSLQARKDYYRDQLATLEKQSSKTFACRCSRRQIQKVSANGLYPGTCRDEGLSFVPGRHALRLRVDDDTRITVGGCTVNLARDFGDFVLWRKDDQPSYQLQAFWKTKPTHDLYCQGEDLFLSTAAQVYLAECFGFTSFPACHFYHHGLILGPDGGKLSKSRAHMHSKICGNRGWTQVLQYGRQPA